MASFVETATLLLEDSASKNINKVNRSLRELFATVNKMRSTRIDLSVRGTERLHSASKALRDLNRLQAARPRGAVPLVGSRDIQTLGAIERQARDAAAAVELIGKDGPSTGLRAIRAMLNEIRADARGAQQAMSGFGRNARPRSDPSMTQQATQIQRQQQGTRPALDWSHWFRGATVYFTINQAQILARSAVLQGMEFERAQGSVAARTTADQAAQINLIKAQRDSFLTTAQVQKGIADNMSDAGGDVKAATAIFNRQVQAAEKVALGRGVPFQDAFAEINGQMNKTVGLLTDTVVENGKLTKRAEAMFAATEDALIAQPDLRADVQRSTAAMLKSLRQTVSPDEFFRLSIIAADQNSRAGNSLFQAAQALEGQQKKAANAFLQAQGLQTERGAVDSDLLKQDPSLWFAKNFFPKIEAQVKKRSEELGRALTRQEEVGVAVDFSREAFGRQTAQDIANEFFASQEALNRAQKQRADAALNENKMRAIQARQWTTELDRTMARFNDALGAGADSLGNVLQPAIRSAGDAFAALNSFITGGPGGEPSAARTGVVAGGAVAAGAGALFAGKKLLDFVNPVAGLNGAATNLKAAAAALIRAAGAQGAGDIAGDFGRNGKGGTAKMGMGLLPATGLFGASAVATLVGLSWLRENSPVARSFIDAARTENLLGKVPPNKEVGPGGMVKTKAAPRALLDELVERSERRRTSIQESQSMIKVESATVEMGKIMALERQDAARPATGLIPGVGEIASTTIRDAFGLGSLDAQGKVRDGMTQGAQQSVPTIISGHQQGGQSAAAAIRDAHSAGAQSAAQIISSAIANAAANVRVNVTTNMPNGPAPANVGANTGGSP